MASENVIVTFAAKDTEQICPRQRNVFRALRSTLRLAAKEDEGALTETSKLIPRQVVTRLPKRPRTLN
jgi:hypothetical protein